MPGAKMRKELAVFAGKEIEAVFTRKKKHRSDPQNRYYWGVVVEMVRVGMKDIGDILDKDQVHELLRYRFLKRRTIDENTGELMYEYAESTASLGTIEFSEYIEKCCQFAAEFLGVEIPLPE